MGCDQHVHETRDGDRSPYRAAYRSHADDGRQHRRHHLTAAAVAFFSRMDSRSTSTATAIIRSITGCCGPRGRPEEPLLAGPADPPLRRAGRRGENRFEAIPGARHLILRSHGWRRSATAIPQAGLFHPAGPESGTDRLAVRNPDLRRAWQVLLRQHVRRWDLYHPRIHLGIW